MNNNIVIILTIIILYLVGYCCMKGSTFEGIPELEGEITIVPQKEKDIHLYDSRYQYPMNPPVNPVAEDAVILNKIRPTPLLDMTDEFNASGNILDYSGGHGQMIKIPLQYNTPFESEMLRSQNVMVTPYNRVKYAINNVDCQSV